MNDMKTFQGNTDDPVAGSTTRLIMNRFEHVWVRAGLGQLLYMKGLSELDPCMCQTNN